MFREHRLAILGATGAAVVLWTLLLDALDTSQSLQNLSRVLMPVGLALVLAAVAGFAVVFGLRGERSASLPGSTRALVLVCSALALLGGGSVAAWVGTGRNVGAKGPGFFTHNMEDFRLSRSPEGLWELHMQHGAPTIELTAYELGSDPSTSELLEAADLVGRTVAAAHHFMDYEATRNGSFTVSNQELLGRKDEWIHLYSPANMRDGRTLDPSAPEALVYHTPGEDVRKARLVGIMYMAPAGEHGPQVGGPLTRWHYHTAVEYCMDGDGVPTVVPQPDTQGALSCPEGQHYGRTPEMMHVWLVNNPWGVFSHQMALATDSGLVMEHAH